MNNDFKNIIFSLKNQVAEIRLNRPNVLNSFNYPMANEVIFALSSTVEADTTNFYIFKQIEPFGVKTSTIARGIAVGDELEYADEVTLGRSILARIPFDNGVF